MAYPDATAVHDGDPRLQFYGVSKTPYELRVRSPHTGDPSWHLEVVIGGERIDALTRELAVAVRGIMAGSAEWIREAGEYLQKRYNRAGEPSIAELVNAAEEAALALDEALRGLDG